MKKIITVLFLLTALFCIPAVASASDSCYTASVEGTVSLHIAPSVDSLEITTIPACAEVTVIEKSGSWGLIEYDNKSGWINMSYTRSSYRKAAEATGIDSEKLITVQSESGVTNLWNVPDVDGADKEKGQAVPNGTVLEIYRETPNGWGLVIISDNYTWIDLKETKPYTQSIDIKEYEIYYVYALSSDGNGVKMWKNETADEVCAVIPDCTQLTAREKSGNYIYVSYDGMNGWIDSKQTEISLFNAQVKAGHKVEECFVVDTENSSKEVDLLAVPSYKEKDGANIIGTIPEGKEVFVLRGVRGGWSLVQYNDNLGWIPPDNLKTADRNENLENITVPETSKEGYIATEKGCGITLYAKTSGKKKTATIPETAKITVVAEKDGYKYVYCDYASGWAKDVSIVSDIEEAMELNSGNYGEYTLKKDTELMSLPINEEALGSEIICLIEKGTVLKKIRTVKTDEDTWAMVEYEGNKGWVKIYEKKADGISAWAIAGIVSEIVLLLAGGIIAVRKRNNLKKCEKEVMENEKELSDEDSRAHKEPADVPGK